jgi:F0F1-type ATP synthase assembly protein I
MPDDNDKQKEKEAKAWYEAATLGFVFPFATGIGFLIGYWLDPVFHTSPWLKIIFTTLGIAAGFVQLFRAGSGSDGG